MSKKINALPNLPKIFFCATNKHSIISLPFWLAALLQIRLFPKLPRMFEMSNWDEVSLKEMNSIGDLSQSQEYLSFRSVIPLKKIIVDSNSSKVNFKSVRVDVFLKWSTCCWNMVKSFSFINYLFLQVLSWPCDSNTEVALINFFGGIFNLDR